MTGMDWLVALSGLAVALFTGALLGIERGRQRANFEIKEAKGLGAGKYAFLVVNKGHHDSAIEEVRLIHIARQGSDTQLKPEFVRRMAKTPDEVRGLGLMVRSGERLWFVAKTPMPQHGFQFYKGTRIELKAVLETKWKSYLLQGATVSALPPPPPGTEEDDL